jgi:hypothetical protein
MIKNTRKKKREKETAVNFFVEFIKIKEHFFKDINQRLKNVKDSRNKSYIDYKADILLFSVIMKNSCGIYSMCSMTEKFNMDECIENVAKALGYSSLEELPHHDTINNFLSNLENTEVESIRDYMIRELFKKRSLECYRILGKYWCIAIDATGLFSFNKRHCEHCLKREHKDKKTGEIIRTTYYHSVLEAKLVLGDMVLSIETEFIENEDENVPKQDCEIKAFKRLQEKLKKNYPRLPICLLGDSLYACEPVFEICDKNNWKFLIRFKEGSISTVAREFEMLKPLTEMRNETSIWVKDIAYNERFVNLIETKIESKEKTKTFVFITNINITPKNANEIVDAGRSRWKIENQGFNNQKTKRYMIEHANSRNYNAMKNHYLISQIADILRQLYENGALKIRELKKGIKEISSILLESFRKIMITEEDISSTQNRIQIRFL